MKLDGARRSLLLPASMAAGAVWAYRLLGIGFLSDDFVQLLDYVSVTAPPVTAWFGREAYGYYRPLTAVVTTLSHALWGMNAVGYRLLNLGLHCTCAVCVFSIARRLGMWPRAALLAALLFAYNPGSTIGVLAIVGVAGTLCAALYLASLAAHLRAREAGSVWYAASLTAFAAALLTKETAVSLPFVVLAVHLLVLRGDLRGTVRWVAPYFGVLVGYLGLRYWLFGHLTLATLAHQSGDPLAIVTNAILYAGTALSPWGLDWLKPTFRGDPRLLAVVCGVVLAAGMGAAVVFRRQWRRAHLFWAIWFGLTLAPAVRVYSPWNSYLPVVGTSILLAAWVYRPGPCWWSRIGRSAIYAWLALAMCYQFRYQADWIRASHLAERVITETALAAEQAQSAWYLAGVPAEYRGVPVFGGPWGIDGALRLRGAKGVLPTVLPTVHYERIDSGAAAMVDSNGGVTLRVRSEADFFRLNEVSILSRKAAPVVGFSFTAGPYSARVAEVNGQGQPAVLTLVPAGSMPPARVLTWDGARLAPAVRSEL